MEDCHRKVIIDNIEKLMKFTSYAELIKACVQANIISSIMMRNIENLHDADGKQKHRALWVKLTKRGPEAYDKIHETLRKLGYYDAAKILRCGENSGFDISLKNKNILLARESSISPDKLITSSTIYNDGCITSKYLIGDKIQYDKDNRNILQIYTKDVPNKFHVIKSNKLCVHGKIEVYPMRTKDNRGVLFMVNIIDFPKSLNEKKRRNGAEIDRDNMIHLFRELGFKIFYYENKTLEEFHMLLDKLLASSHVKDTECFILSLMTHGNMEDCVERAEFYDGAVEKLTNILDKFRNDVCRYLIRTPKIFFFPFCRGSVSDVGTYSFKPKKKIIESDGIDVKLPKNLATYSDMLICYATVPGFKVHRDPDEGSWYIQKLCEVFAKNAHDTHIEDLLQLVGDKTGEIRTDDGKLQIASTTNYGFFKKLYFNPGYYDI